MKSLETKWILTRSYFKSNLTEMVIDVYNAENKKKNKKFVDLIRNGQSRFRNEIDNMSENENRIENQIKLWILLKRFLNLIIKTKQVTGSKY